MDKLSQAYVPPGRIDLAREDDFAVGVLLVRPSRRQVEADGVHHVLQRRVMQVLVALARSTSEVVSQRELIMRCWDGLSVSEDAIGRCIAQLRRLAATWPEPPFEIETIAGVGYRLAARPVKATPQALAALAPHRRTSAWILLSVAAFAAVAAGLWAVRDHLPFVSRPPPARVAVLPFDTLSGGAGAQAFADGLLDEMLGALSSDQVQALSRTDSTELRGASARQAVRRLDIGLFLDGTVREEAGVIKVRAYLNDAGDHTTIWSHDFEAPDAQAGPLQAQVAARTTDVAHWALLARRRAPSPLDSETLAAFVEACDQLSNTGAQAEPLLRQVIAKSPDFARAHSLLAIALSDNGSSEVDRRGLSGASLSARTSAARREAMRALQLDPATGEAYLALARDTAMGAWGEREAWLAKGLAVEPDFAYLSYFQSQFLGQVGRLADSSAFAERAVALNPLFVGANANLCVRLSYLGRAQEERSACERTDRLWPGAPINEITQFYLDLEAGNDRGANERLLRPAAAAYFGPTGVRDLSRFLDARAAGQAGAARAAALAAAADADAGQFDRRDAYIILAQVGEVDGALRQATLFYTPERLRQAAGPTSLDTIILFMPATAAVRRDRRFIALMSSMGLADYWRTGGSWPDFCGEPGLPYDCRHEAAKLSAVRRTP